jgi:hypothetical protein
MAEAEKVEEKVEETQEVVVEEQQLEEKVNSKEPPKKEDMNEDELESYTKGVQKRIKKLTEKYRQEEKEKQEAVALSQKLMEDNKKLQAKVKNLDTGYVSEYGTRLQAQSEQAKRMYTEAYEAGDANKMAEAQQAMAAIAVEQQNYNTARTRVEQQNKQMAAQQATQQAQNIQQPQQPQQPAKIDPRAKQWADENTWFGKDTIMTTATFALHNILTGEEGFDANSEEYYTEIDKRIREEFPHKFQTQKKSGSNQVASAGNSASRNTQKRKTVKLTPYQVAISKKLGVPLEEYAKYVKE